MGKKARGAEAFEEFYAKAWGERWPKLKNSLIGPKTYAAIKNPGFKGIADFSSIKTKELWPQIELLEKGGTWPEVVTDDQGNRSHYMMDPASCLAAHYLGVESGDEVLDLCAAPGGKSLILLNRLKNHGKLVANDRSRDRRERLKRVLSEHFPSAESFDLQVTGHDASSWCLHQKEAFDKILLDAPCSSERHVFESPKHLDEWGVGRTQRLSKDQWTMLASALDVVRIGGRIIYSTCSLSPLENEKIIEKLLAKRGDRVRLIDIDSPFIEKASLGYYMLPDNGGWGPIFFCLIERIG